MIKDINGQPEEEVTGWDPWNWGVPLSWHMDAFAILKGVWAPLIKVFYGGFIILELLIKPLVFGDWIQPSGLLHSVEFGFGTEVFNPVILPWSLWCPAHPPFWKYLGPWATSYLSTKRYHHPRYSKHFRDQAWRPSIYVLLYHSIATVNCLLLRTHKRAR